MMQANLTDSESVVNVSKKLNEQYFKSVSYSFLHLLKDSYSDDNNIVLIFHVIEIMH